VHNKYRIGKLDYSLIDIFHILRGNPKHPLLRHRHLRSTDPRRLQTINLPDNKIHFVVSFLTTSSPFIRVIHPGMLEEDLSHAVEEFCLNHINVDVAKKEVTLPALFKYYQNDFGRSREDILIWLFPYLSKEIRIKLFELMEKRAVQIVYAPFSTDPSPLEPPVKEKEKEKMKTDILGTSPLSTTIEQFQLRVRSNTLGTVASNSEFSFPTPFAPPRIKSTKYTPTISIPQGRSQSLSSSSQAGSPRSFPIQKGIRYFPSPPKTERNGTGFDDKLLQQQLQKQSQLQQQQPQQQLATQSTLKTQSRQGSLPEPCLQQHTSSNQDKELSTTKAQIHKHLFLIQNFLQSLPNLHSAKLEMVLALAQIFSHMKKQFDEAISPQAKFQLKARVKEVDSEKQVMLVSSLSRASAQLQAKVMSLFESVQKADNLDEAVVLNERVANICNSVQVYNETFQ